MVDLMMWLVIAALLLAAAIQSIGYYQRAAYVYHIKSDLTGAGEVTFSHSVLNGGTLDNATVQEGVAATSWTQNVSASVEEPSNGTLAYIRAVHPGLTDVDGIYLFKDCGSMTAGVHIIPKGGTPITTACGISASPGNIGGTDGTGSGGTTFESYLVGWGHNGYGQLADGTTIQRNSPSPSDSTNVLGTNITKVVVGGSNGCAIVNKEAYCWGLSSTGQMGNGVTDDFNTKFPVTKVGGALTGLEVTDISISPYHACVVASGKAYCWGRNFYGTLGDGTRTTRTTPVPVMVDGSSALKSTMTVSSIDVGESHTCATAAGEVYCWGNNTSGQLGTGAATPWETIPKKTVATALGNTVTEIEAGNLDTCAISGGNVYCWGDNNKGVVGNGTSGTTAVPAPSLVGGAIANKTITNIALGYTHVCVSTGTDVYCWGNNGVGQFGGVQSAAVTTPRLVTDLPTATGNKAISKVTTAQEHTCALAAGEVYCWGFNSQGQVGTGQTPGAVYNPVRINVGSITGKEVLYLETGGISTMAIARK